jgi:glycosyltransferase involved in cell wall biosynthesis
MTSTQLHVLHVVGRLSRGGTETWLLRSIPYFAASGVQMSILVHADGDATMEEEFRSLGVSIHRTKYPIGYIRCLRRLVQSHQITAIHSHLKSFSGWPLLLSKIYRIPHRIAHIHCDGRLAASSSLILTHPLDWLGRLALLASFTRGIAVSPFAAAYFGRSTKTASRVTVQGCGVDASSYMARPPANYLAMKFGIRSDVKTILHIGRMVEVKNHKFLIDVFEAYHDINPKSHLLLVGDGPLRAEIVRLIANKRIEESVTLVGSVPNPCDLLMSCDCFVFPSISEGAPLVTMEAQAAGIPLIVSEAVPEQNVVIPELVTKIPLQSGPSVWASTIARTIEVPSRPQHCASRVKASALSIERSVDACIASYQ